MLINLKDKIMQLPQSPGVYLFRDAKKVILYIGKATNLRSRVQSYFRGGETRGHIESMMPSVMDVDFLETDSVLEALILEANLIKKHQPKYNMKEKDDKSFSYFIITKEEFPRVLILRKTDIEQFQISKSEFQNKSKIQNSKIFGPYTSKKQMEIALKIIRKIFPFHAGKNKTEKGCLDFQLGRCPGPYAGAISKADYAKNICGIKMILEGKKGSLLKKMEKEMGEFAKRNEFEKAAEIRNKIFALQHIQDVALISRDDKIQITRYKSQKKSKNQKLQTTNFRIEAYDISNLSGQQAVGSMVVFEDKEPNKKEYRKFKIKTIEGANDVGMMREVLLRRFKNAWAQPDLIFLDGGMGHLHMAEKLLQELGLVILLVAVAKGPSRKNLNFHFPPSQTTELSKEIKDILEDKNLIKAIMDEAHRFAITYHKKVRRREFI